MISKIEDYDSEGLPAAEMAIETQAEQLKVMQIEQPIRSIIRSLDELIKKGIPKESSRGNWKLIKLET